MNFVERYSLVFFLLLSTPSCGARVENEGAGEVLSQTQEIDGFQITFEELSSTMDTPANVVIGGEGQIEVRGSLVTNCGTELIGARAGNVMRGPRSGETNGVGRFHLALIEVKPSAACLFSDETYAYRATTPVPSPGQYRVRVSHREAGVRSPDSADVLELRDPTIVLDTIVEVR